MIVLTVILAVLGVLILAVGVAGAAGVLPGNPVVGLRIPEVRKSKEMWTIGHKIAGPAWIGAGVALILAGVVAANAGGFLWLIVALLVIGAVVLWGMGAGLAAHALANLDAKRIATEAASSDGCCSSGGGAGGAGAAVAGGGVAGEPSAAECASGHACGSCSLNGACEGGGAAFDAGAGGGVGAAGTKPDLDAARRAAEAQDQR